MNKQKAKAILNWILFAACIVGAAYMGFAAHGLTVTERIALAGTSLGGLFVAMGSLLPRLNKAIDDLPGDAPRDPQKGETSLLVAIILGVVAIFLGVSFGYSGKARADEATPAKWKHSLTLGVVATMIDFRSRAITFGAPVGSCYGATYVPWDAGLAGCLYAQAATDKTPNMLLSSIQGSYKGNIGLGVGVLAIQGEPSVSAVGFVSGNVPLF